MNKLVLIFSLLTACGPFISPKVAYETEVSRCQGDQEAVRRCTSMLDKKYGRYFGEGDYPRAPR